MNRRKRRRRRQEAAAVVAAMERMNDVTNEAVEALIESAKSAIAAWQQEEDKRNAGQ